MRLRFITFLHGPILRCSFTGLAQRLEDKISEMDENEWGGMDKDLRARINYIIDTLRQYASDSRDIRLVLSY